MSELCRAKSALRHSREQREGVRVKGAKKRKGREAGRRGSEAQQGDKGVCLH